MFSSAIGDNVNSMISGVPPFGLQHFVVQLVGVLQYPLVCAHAGSLIIFRWCLSSGPGRQPRHNCYQVQLVIPGIFADAINF